MTLKLKTRFYDKNGVQLCIGDTVRTSGGVICTIKSGNSQLSLYGDMGMGECWLCYMCKRDLEIISIDKNGIRYYKVNDIEKIRDS